MNKNFYLILCVAYSSALYALPEGGETAAGNADFSRIGERLLKVEVSDKAIINYRTFNIGKDEKVTFVQPSSKSCVLNRINGSNASKILGQLNANGKVFLVNPHGVYFGPDASVSTGSFLASTLNIRDEDFLNENYQFFLEKGFEKSSIINEGLLEVGAKGFIALFSPTIKNYGSILARAGKVALASAEKILLDFSGDGFISFVVDGELKHALIENYGQIESAGGHVQMALKTAQQAIKMVVNTDGVNPAVAIEEEGGVIRLVGTSRVAAQSVHIKGDEGSQIELQGEINVSDLSAAGVGGGVEVRGGHIALNQAAIDASGNSGGGVVLIGGEYQGKGDGLNAETTLMDNQSSIIADAKMEGNGGTVILWADDLTAFDGKIYARGGKNGGNGGFVETSGKENLRVMEGFVDTSASSGRFGQWLLDPATVVIANAGAATIAQCSAPNCGDTSNRTISPATIAASLTNVSLCAQRNATSSITVTNAVVMSNPGISLSLTAGSGSAGTINLNNNLTTRGGNITLTGVVVLGSNVALDTTNAGGSPAGANITFSSTVNGSGARTLNLIGGTGGTVTFTGAVGATTALSALTVSAASILQNSNARTTGAVSYTAPTLIRLSGFVRTAGGVINISGPVTLNAATIIDATNSAGTPAGANITLTGGVNGAQSLTLTGGTAGAVSFGALGAVTPLSSVTATGLSITQTSTAKTTGTISYNGTSGLNLGGNITTSGSTMSLTGAATLTGTVNLDSTNAGASPNGANITFSSTVNGAQPLSAAAGAVGNVTFGAIGATTPLSSLTVSGATLNQNATVQTSGAISYSAATVSNLSGNLTTAGSQMSFTGPVSLNANVLLNTTNTAPAGANIAFSGVVNGARTFTLTAGTAGIITFGAALGPTANLTSISASGLTVNQNSTAKTSGTVSYTGTSAINLSGNITTTANAITLTGPVNLNNTVVLDTTNAGGSGAGSNITLSSTVNGANALTLRGGTAGVVGFGAAGSTTPLSSLTVTGATINQNSTVASSGPISYSAAALNLGGNITTSSGAIGMTGPVNLTASVIADATNGGMSSGANITFSSTINGAQNLTLTSGSGSVSAAGAIGAASALTALTSSGTSLTFANIGAAGSGVTGSTSMTASGSLNFLGTTYNAGAQTYNAAVNFNLNAGALTTFTSNGQAIAFNTGTVQLSSGTNLTVNSTNGTIALPNVDAVSGNLRTLILSGGTGNVQVGAIGTLAASEFSSVVISGGNIQTLGNIITSSITLTPGVASTIFLGGGITTLNTPIIFSRPVVRNTTASATLSTGATGANIQFQNTLDGDAPYTRNLTLAAGAGNITFSGAVGSINPLGILTISTAADVTAAAVTATSLVQSAGTGTTTFNGLVSTNGIGGVNLTGNNFTINSDITTTNGGPVSINHSGVLTIAPTATITASGGYIDSGSGSGNLSGNIITNGQDITFSTPVTLGGTASLNTGVGVGNILFTSTINGAQNLTLTAGGNINLNGAVGGSTRLGILTIGSTNNFTASNLTLSSFTQTAGTGVSTFNGAINTNGMLGFSLNGTNAAFNSALTTTNGGPATVNVTATLILAPAAIFSLDGAFTKSGIGATQSASSITTTNDNISFSGPFFATATTTLNSGSGNILFSGTVDGTGGLNLTAGLGNLTFMGAVGSSTRLGDLTINSAAAVSTQSVKAISINQISASSTTNYNGTLDTVGAGGISITGGAITINGIVLTTGGGPLNITNSGQLNLTAGSGSLLSGSFTQTGAGNVNLAGALAATNSNITFASPITLTANATLNTGAGTGNISLTTVDGAQSLGLSSGSGSINIGAVGFSTRLGDLTFTSANNITASSIRAASLTQLGSSGIATFNGAIDTNTAGGINLTGSAIVLNAALTTSGMGPLAINNSGTLNFAFNGASSIAGSLSQVGTGAVTLSGQITAGGAISFASAVSLAGSPQLNNAASGSNILFSGALNGPGNLTLLAGGGDIILASAAGSTSRLGALTISSARNVDTLGISAASILQSAGTGTTTINGNLNTNGGSGIVLMLNNLSQTGQIITTALGPVTVANSGQMASTLTAGTSIAGAFAQTGLGPVSLSGTLATLSQPISFARAITLSADAALSTGTGAAITLSSTVNGPYALTLAAGTGSILASAAIGAVTPLTSFTISQANNVTTQAISAGSITQSTGSGLSSFGALTASSISGIQLMGTQFSLNAPISAPNAGPVQITHTGLLTVGAGANISCNGAFTESGGGNVLLGANITTSNDLISFSDPVTLTGPVSLSTGIGTGSITFTNTLNGAQTFSADAGSGDVLFSGAIGGSVALSSLTLAGNNITLGNIGSVASGVSGAAVFSALTDLSFNGTTYNLGAQTFNATTIQLNSGALTTFTTNGNPIVFTGSSVFFGTGAGLTVNSTGGNITLSPLRAATGSLRTAIFNAGTGQIQTAGIGTAGNTEFASVTLNGGNLLLRGDLFSNALTLASTMGSTIFLGSNITTVNSPILFPAPVVRDTIVTSTLSSGPSGGAITFQSSLNSNVAGTRNVIINAGAANVTLGAVGNVAALNSLTIAAAGNVSSSTINVGNLAQSGVTGTSTFNGAITTSDVLGISLSGSAFTFNSTITTTGGGPLTIANSGLLTMNPAATTTLSGKFNQTGAGISSLANAISSSTDSVQFTGPVFLAGATNISTAASNNSITFGSTINGGSDLTLTAGTGNILFSGAIGQTTRIGALRIVSAQNINILSTRSASIEVNGGTGTYTVNGDTDTNGMAGILLVINNLIGNGNTTTTNGGPFTLTNSGTLTATMPGTYSIDGSFLQNGTGPMTVAGSLASVTGDVTFNSPVTIFAPSSIQTNGGNITFLSALDGPFAFSFSSGTGDINFGPVGSVVAIGDLTISSARNVTGQSIRAASITQTSGTGTTQFSGNITTTGASGISITTHSFARGAAITTLNGGPLSVAIDNAGTFTSTAVGAISLDGAFTQTGTGAVALGRTITTTNDAISFAGPITLNSATSLNTGAAGANITLSSTVQGAQNLSLDSGGGSIVLGGAVGTAMTPLNALTFVKANHVSTGQIFAGSITQNAGTGTTTFGGALTTSAIGGISLTGTGFNFQGSITTTTGSGPLSLTNSGLAIFQTAATATLGGAFNQFGTGTTQLGSAITAGGLMQFSGPVTTAGTAAALNNSAAMTPGITFLNELDGPGSLSLNAGAGSLVLQHSAGSTTPLNVLAISSSGSVSTQALAAASISQTGTGSTVLNADVNTTGILGIDLTGAAFTLLGNMTAAGSGPISIANTGLLTTTIGKTITAGGAFTQSGAGAVSLAGTVRTNHANLSFAADVTLTAPVSLDTTFSTGMTSGSISFVNINGTQNFTLAAGSGNIVVAGAMGSITPLGAIIVTNANNITIGNTFATSILQVAGTGTTTLSGNLTTSGVDGINLTGNNFTRSGAIIVGDGGSLIVNNSGLLTGTMINTTTVGNAYRQTGTGPVNFAGTITTLVGEISFAGPITLVADGVLNSSAGSGGVSITNTINGPRALTVQAGVGNVSFTQPIGAMSALTSFTISGANNLSANSISAGAISATGLTGTALFNGALSTSSMAGVALSGNIFTINNVSTGGGGVFTLSNSGLATIPAGTAFNLDGAFAQSGTGSVAFGGSITTTNDAISFGSAMNLTAAASLNSGAGAGALTLSGPINGAFSLNLTAGTGNISLQSSVGLVTPLTTLNINSAAAVTCSGGILLSGPFNIFSATGSTAFNGSLTATAVNLTGAAITFNQPVQTTSGTISIANSGTLTVALSAPISSATGFSQTGTGAVSLGANISTTGLLSIASALTLTNHINMSSGGGNLDLLGTVSGVFDLTLAAGAGNITMGSTIGTPRIGIFTITGAQDVFVQAINAASISLLNGTGTANLVGNLDTNTPAGISLVGNNFVSSGTINTTNGGPLTITNTGLVTGTGASTVTLDGFYLQNGTGPSNFGGTLTTNNANITISGPANVLLPAVFTTGGGNILFANTVDGPDCLTLNAGTGDIRFEAPVGATTPLGCLSATGDNIVHVSALQSTGAVIETAAQNINIGGSITTSMADITLNGDVTVASVTLSTGAGIGDISISGIINGNTVGRSLVLSAGTGDITLSNTIGGGTPFLNLTLSANNISWADLGSTVIGATGTSALTAAGDINFTGTSYNNGTQIYTAGANFNFTAGAPTTISSNVLPITFNTGGISLGTTDLTVNSNGGTITLTSLLGTGRDLTVDADVGDFNFVQIGAMGQNLNNVFLTADTFSPTPSSGVNVFANALTVNTPTILTISTNQSSGATTYNSPVVIQGNISYACGVAGTITFNRTVDANTPGMDSLSFDFNPCTGSVVFNSPVGAISPLASISVDAATDVTFNSTVNLGSLAITNGTGTASINSGINTSGIGGISIAIPDINIMGSIETLGGGPIVLDNSGTLTIAAGSTFDIDGAFQQIGTGAVNVGGMIMTHDAVIAFTGPLTLNSSTQVSSQDMAGANISFGSTIAGAQSLKIASGGADITFGGALGTAMIPLHDVEITSARDVTAGDIFATTMTQLSGSGTASYNGVLNTNGLLGIRLTGSVFNLNGNVTTTSLGPLVITNAGALNLNAASYSVSGAFSQNGTGSTTFSGTLQTGGSASFSQSVTLSGTSVINTSANNLNITFAGPVTNNGMGPHDLSLNAGGGNIFLSGAVGATPIGAFTITNAANVTAAAISAASITQTAGSGLTTISGNLTTTAMGGIQMTGTEFSVNSTLVTTGGGSFGIVNSGPAALSLGMGTSLAGVFSQSGGGTIFLSGTVLTNNQNITFTNAINLTGSTLISSGAGAGTLTFNGAINGNHSLNLTAGTGSIVFMSALGLVNPLGALTVASVNNVTYPQINASSIVQTGSTGVTTVTGPFSTTGMLGVSLSGGVINQNGLISTSGAGPVTFSNTGLLTVGIGANTVSSGSYSQSGGGAVSLGGNISSANQTITLTGGVTLTADVMINSGSVTNGDDITFASTIAGPHTLTLRSPDGGILLGGNVGTAMTPLTSLIIQLATDVSTQQIFAGSITQSAGTGTTTFGGALTTSAIGGISLTGSGFNFQAPITTTSGSGPFSLTNSGLAIFQPAATATIGGVFNQFGLAATQLGSAITAGGPIQFAGPVTTSGTAAALNNAAAMTPGITFLNDLDGPGSLTLNAGAGSLVLQHNAGSITPLNVLAISSSGSVSTQALAAASISQTGTGSTIFNSDVNTTGVLGTDLAGTAFTLLGNMTAGGSGPISIANTGLLTTTLGKTITAGGAFTQSGAGAVNLAGTVRTNHANLSFAADVTLIAPVSIDTTFSTGMTSGSISFVNIDGTQSFTLAAGTGNIVVTGAMGSLTPLGAITVTNANNITIGDTFATSILQIAGTGTTTLNGDLTTSGIDGVNLTGNNFTRSGAIIVGDGGSLIVNNSGLLTGTMINTTTIGNAYRQIGTGPVNFAGTITTLVGEISFAGPITLVANGVLDSSSGTGGVSITNTINGARSLTIQAGAGDVVITQPIGGAAALTNLTISGDVVSLQNIGGASPGISVTTTVNAAGSINFSGSIYNANAQTYTAADAFNITQGSLSTFTSNNNPLSFSGAPIILAGTSNLTMNTLGGNLDLMPMRASINSGRTFIAATGSGTLNAEAIGSVAQGQFALVSLSGSTINLNGDLASDAVTLSPLVVLNAGGSIFTTNTPLNFPSPLVLNATNTFSTGSTGASITFQDIFDGDVDNTRGLTLAAGSGSITFSGIIGGVHPLTGLTILSANNVTAIENVTANSILQFSGSGKTTFAGSVNVPFVAGISLTGNQFEFNDTVTVTNNGSLQINNAGTLTFAATGNLSGAFTQSGVGTSILSGSITAGQPILFTGPVDLSGSPSLSTSAASQSITFSSFVNGPGNLDLAAGGGDIVFLQNAGLTTPMGTVRVINSHDVSTKSVSAVSIDILASTGTATLDGNLTTTGAAGISLVGNNFFQNGIVTVQGGGGLTITNSGSISGGGPLFSTTDGSFIQNGTGPFFFAGTLTSLNGDISIASPFSLLGPGQFTTGALGSIVFSNTVDGPGDSGYLAGSGGIQFNAALGSGTRMGSITLSSGGGVTAQQSIFASSLTQTAGAGTTDLQADVDINTSGGIHLTGNQFIRGGVWTTTNAGPIVVNNTGSFTSTAPGTISASGGFSQTGAGIVTFGGRIETDNAAISFTGPVNLSASADFFSGTGLGGMLFSGSINGAQNLTINAGLGNAIFNGAVGNTTRLGDIFVVTAADLSFQSLRAASLNQGNGTGSTLLSGPTDVNGGAGIEISGNNVTIAGMLTTSNNGPVSIFNSGSFTMSANANIAGFFLQDRSGPSTLSGSMATGGTIIFSGPLSVSGSAAALATSNQDILLGGSLDGPGNLSANSGTADTRILGSTGANTRLGQLVFTSMRNLTTTSITAGSVMQMAGTGLTDINGDINTNTAQGFSLTGNAIQITGSIVTTGGGPVTLAHSGALQITAGSSTSIAGAFLESGAGSVSFAGQLHTVNANITFTNPLTLLGDAGITTGSGAGDLLFSNTVNGTVQLSVGSGSGNTTFAMDLGSLQAPTRLTIQNANAASFQAVTAGSIVQLAGSGTTTFNSPILTTLPDGIVLTGNQFTFNSTVDTQAFGPLQITNAGLMSLQPAANINLTGNFSQLGSGPVSFCTTISTNGHPITFNGPITLCNTGTLDSGASNSDILFNGSIDGAQTLNIAAGGGSIQFNQTIGQSTPPTLIRVTSCSELTAQQITAGGLDFTNISELATFNGGLTTTGAAGVSISGKEVHFLNQISASNTGSFLINNSGPVTFSPAGIINTDGTFTQAGTGDVFIGGNLTTNNQNITFQSSVNLNGNFTVNSGAGTGDILFSQEIEGFNFFLNADAGLGDIRFLSLFCDDFPFQNMSASAGRIFLNGIGGAQPGVLGTLTLNALDSLNFSNIAYTAAAIQNYSAGNTINFTEGSEMDFTSFGQDISFLNGTMILGSGSDLTVKTGNGNFTFQEISATSFENFTIQAGSGTVAMHRITGGGTMNNLTVSGGQIEFYDVIDPVNVDFTSTGSIMNASAPVQIVSSNNASFNAFGGDVGSLGSPILVDTSNKIFAGSTFLADFNGSSVDNTVHEIPENPPCIIIFNGAVIKDCRIPPTPPTPPPPAPSNLIFNGQFRFPFAAPGFDSSYFNLSSDFFFLSFYLDKRYFGFLTPIYYTEK